MHKLRPRMSPLLAAATEKPLEKLEHVSGQFWIKVILAFAALAVLIFIFKKVMGMNKIILLIICFVIVGVFGFNWVYNRTEPAFLTPIIEPIANSGFLPTKGAYEGKQTQDPLDAKKNKPASTPAQPAKK